MIDVHSVGSDEFWGSTIQDLRMAAGEEPGMFAYWELYKKEALHIVGAFDMPSNGMVGIGFVTDEFPRIRVDEVIVNRNYEEAQTPVRVAIVGELLKFVVNNNIQLLKY